jgi:hypothetical protein
MRELQDIIPSLFTSSPTTFALCHHDLSTSNIIVDPTTYQITGIVDWESVGVIPSWEQPYPEFIMAPEVDEEPKPLEPGEENDCLEQQWEDWENMGLRKVFDGVVAPGQRGRGGSDGSDELKRGFRQQLDTVEQCCTRVENSRRESRSRENIFVSKGLVRLATPSFTRAVSSARSAARE